MTDASADRHRIAWTAESLTSAVFADQQDVVPGLFVEGLSILAGPPKAGKSWLALQAGLDISREEEFLERAVRPGTEVLYLALEDGPRRLKSRISASMAGTGLGSLSGGGVRDGLHLFTQWPEGEKGIATLRAWLGAHPAVKFVVVDVLAVLRGLARGGYSGDYRVMRGLKEIADHFAISILVVTHTRKSKGGDDPFAQIMGSSGVTGAADTLMVMRPVSVDGKLAALHVRGRDVEGQTLEMRLEDGRWYTSGKAAEERREERKRGREVVLDALASEGAAGLTVDEAGLLADVPAVFAAGVLDSAVSDGVARRVPGSDRFAWIPMAERHGAGTGDPE
jgi:hypothetical protein